MTMIGTVPMTVTLTIIYNYDFDFDFYDDSDFG